MGVDHIGVLVGDGSFPREQTIENAHDIFAAIPAGSKASALSLSPDVDLIARLTAALLPDILHLGAAPQHLSPAQLRTLKAEFPQVSLMRSIPVIDESSIPLARSYDGIADWLLLDSYKPGDGQIGALGVTHSWELDRRIIESVRIPAIIAGGLGPENVQDAVRVVRPAGVDSKTKTDRSDGTHTKDLEKVSAFLNAARSANNKISDASTLHQICERKRKCIPLIYVPDVP
jgi:phosphoribosylanthranilate isomerase